MKSIDELEWDLANIPRNTDLSEEKLLRLIAQILIEILRET